MPHPRRKPSLPITGLLPRVLMSVGTLACVLAGALLPAQEPFPKHNPEQAFGVVKVYDAQSSPLRTPAEDWSAAADRVKEDPGWKRWLAERKQEVDEWKTEPRDRAEYVAGWWHDFVDADNGAFLTWTPNPPKGVTPKVFGAWVYGLRSRNAKMMLEAARLWCLTGDRQYFDWAASQLDFYAENYANWPLQTEKATARLMHQSLDDATMLVSFVEAARLLDVGRNSTPPLLTAERRSMWIDKLFLPMAALLDESFKRVHNIACWHRTAQGMVAIYADDAVLWRRAIDGPFGVRQQVREGITSDYFWLEQSLGYNRYVVSALLPLFEFAALNGKLSEIRHEAAIVENLMLAPLVIRFPDGRVPTPADTTGIGQRVPDRAMLAAARRVFPTTIGNAADQTARNWGTLLDPSVASIQDVEDLSLPEVVSRSFESSRFALLKHDGWQVFFHYGQLDRSHAQEEALSYEAYYHSTDVTHDAGTVGYGSPLHRGYYTKAAAHNVPVVDLQGQSGWDPGTLIAFDAVQPSVTASQANYRPDVSAERTVSIENGSLVERTKIVVTDAPLQPATAHRLGLILNLQGSVEPPPDAVSLAEAPFAYWIDARSWQSPASTQIRAQIGGRSFRITVEAPGPMRIVNATVPDAPPARRQALYVEVTGREAEFRVSWKPE